MRNKFSLFFIFGIIALCPQIALGDEIIVEDAEVVWDLALDNATSIGRLVGEPGIMITKYADTLTYYLLENATEIGRLAGEPDVIVTKYADTLTYYLLENATDVGRLVGEPGVMITKYADTFSWLSLENATEVHHLVGEPGVMVTRYADTFSYSDLMSPPFDFMKPMISDVTVTNIALTSATVNWVTDEVADSLVKYGIESGNYTLQKYDSENVTSHSVNLIGLLPNTTYYFVVSSTDLNRNSNESAEYNFTTHISDDTTPPYTSGHDPAKGVVGVPVNTNIVVHVLDSDSGVNLSTILMTVEGANVTPVITGTPADYTLTHDPSVNFDYGQVVDVTVDASDIAGNTLARDAYSFTTTTMGPHYFDTGEGTYPSIKGTHRGTIKPYHDVNVSRMFTYPCAGTGGHTEYVRFENESWNTTANWDDYKGGWHNITFDAPFTLYAGLTYNYSICTGSYPQIHHTGRLETDNGVITCTEFIDANGKRHDDWIPAIRLE